MRPAALHNFSSANYLFIYIVDGYNSGRRSGRRIESGGNGGTLTCIDAAVPFLVGSLFALTFKHRGRGSTGVFVLPSWSFWSISTLGRREVSFRYTH